MLLAASTGEVTAGAMTEVVAGASPPQAIRASALGVVLNAVDAYSWVGVQLSRGPWQSAVVVIFEGVGGQLQALGVHARAQFDCACALVDPVLGVAGQNAANARLSARWADRSTLRAVVAARRAQLDPAQYPFVHQVAAQLCGHDDREQFLAGVDLVLAGIATIWWATGHHRAAREQIRRDGRDVREDEPPCRCCCGAGHRHLRTAGWEVRCETSRVS